MKPPVVPCFLSRGGRLNLRRVGDDDDAVAVLLLLLLLILVVVMKRMAMKNT